MIPKSELRFEYMRGTGPGGQHKNKTATACRVTHKPTGISAYADTRSQHASKKMALRDLETKLKGAVAERRAVERKARRDLAIKDTATVRTYDYKSQTVYDHRTGKSANLKRVLEKGEIERLR